MLKSEYISRWNVQEPQKREFPQSAHVPTVRRMRIGIGLLAQSDEATQGDLTQSTIQ